MRVCFLAGARGSSQQSSLTRQKLSLFASALDTQVTAWHGTESSPFERAKAADLQDEIVASRHGHALKVRCESAPCRTKRCALDRVVFCPRASEC